MKIFGLIIILLLGITCNNNSNEKKKENLQLLSLLAYQQAIVNKPVDTTPSCKLIASGLSSEFNVPLITATSTAQKLTYYSYELAPGFAFLGYTVVRVTAKVNGKLLLSGASGSTISTITYANVDPCSINQNTTTAIDSTNATVTNGTNSVTVTLKQANTYLVVIPIYLSSLPTNASLQVQYSDL